jgi:hypothetical protein
LKELFILSLKIDGDVSIVHYHIKTQHLHASTPICNPILMETNNCHHVMANYKMRLAGSYEYNNEPFWLAEPSLFYFKPSLPFLGRFHSNELIWTNKQSCHLFWVPSMQCLKRCGIHIISFNPKDTSFIWHVITFLVNITACQLHVQRWSNIQINKVTCNKAFLKRTVNKGTNHIQRPYCNSCISLQQHSNYPHWQEYGVNIITCLGLLC